MKVELLPAAARQLSRLNEPILGRIIAALVKLRQEPPEGDIKALKGHPNAYRVRVGKYRILYTVYPEGIDVFKIAPRGEAYKEI